MGMLQWARQKGDRKRAEVRKAAREARAGAAVAAPPEPEPEPEPVKPEVEEVEAPTGIAERVFRKKKKKTGSSGA